MGSLRKIAIIGSGITGLGAAHALNGVAQVSLFEAGSYFGGHANTVDVTLPTPHGERTHGIDTGFLVYNERTYPNLIALFEQLGVHTSDVSTHLTKNTGILEGSYGVFEVHTQYFRFCFSN